MPEMFWLPLIFFMIVVYGAIAVSSWSCPVDDCPFGLSTPTTVNGWFFTRMI